MLRNSISRFYGNVRFGVPRYRKSGSFQKSEPYVRFLPNWIFLGQSASTQGAASLENFLQNLAILYMKPPGHFQTFLRNGFQIFL